MVSRTCSRPHIQATKRSTPMPKPACGTVPKRRRSRYQLNASAGRLCSARRFSRSCEIVNALPAAHNFAVAFGRDHIDAQAPLRAALDRAGNRTL